MPPGVGMTLYSPASTVGWPDASSSAACWVKRSNHASLYANLSPGQGLPFGSSIEVTITQLMAASTYRDCLSVESPGSVWRTRIGSRFRLGACVVIAGSGILFFHTVFWSHHARRPGVGRRR